MGRSMNVLASSVCVYTEDGDKQVRCCAGDQPTEAPYVTDDAARGLPNSRLGAFRIGVITV